MKTSPFMWGFYLLLGALAAYVMVHVVGGLLILLAILLAANP